MTVFGGTSSRWSPRLQLRAFRRAKAALGFAWNWQPEAGSYCRASGRTTRKAPHAGFEPFSTGYTQMSVEASLYLHETQYVLVGALILSSPLDYRMRGFPADTPCGRSVLHGSPEGSDPARAD